MQYNYQSFDASLNYAVYQYVRVNIKEV